MAKLASSDAVDRFLKRTLEEREYMRVTAIEPVIIQFSDPKRRQRRGRSLQGRRKGTGRRTAESPVSPAHSPTLQTPSPVSQRLPQRLNDEDRRSPSALSTEYDLAAPKSTRDVQSKRLSLSPQPYRRRSRYVDIAEQQPDARIDASLPKSRRSSRESRKSAAKAKERQAKRASNSRTTATARVPASNASCKQNHGHEGHADSKMLAEDITYHSEVGHGRKQKLSVAWLVVGEERLYFVDNPPRKFLTLVPFQAISSIFVDKDVPRPILKHRTKNTEHIQIAHRSFSWTIKRHHSSASGSRKGPSHSLRKSNPVSFSTESIGVGRYGRHSPLSNQQSAGHLTMVRAQTPSPTHPLSKSTSSSTSTLAVPVGRRMPAHSPLNPSSATLCERAMGRPQQLSPRLKCERVLSPAPLLFQRVATESELASFNLASTHARHDDTSGEESVESAEDVSYDDDGDDSDTNAGFDDGADSVADGDDDDDDGGDDESESDDESDDATFPGLSLASSEADRLASDPFDRMSGELLHATGDDGSVGAQASKGVSSDADRKQAGPCPQSYIVDMYTIATETPTFAAQLRLHITEMLLSKLAHEDSHPNGENREQGSPPLSIADSAYVSAKLDLLLRPSPLTPPSLRSRDMPLPPKEPTTATATHNEVSSVLPGPTACPSHVKSEPDGDPSKHPTHENLKFLTSSSANTTTTTTSSLLASLHLSHSSPNLHSMVASSLVERDTFTKATDTSASKGEGKHTQSQSGTERSLNLPQAIAAYRKAVHVLSKFYDATCVKEGGYTSAPHCGQDNSATPYSKVQPAQSQGLDVEGSSLHAPLSSQHPMNSSSSPYGVHRTSVSRTSCSDARGASSAAPLDEATSNALEVLMQLLKSSQPIRAMFWKDRTLFSHIFEILHHVAKPAHERTSHLNKKWSRLVLKAEKAALLVPRTADGRNLIVSPFSSTFVENPLRRLSSPQVPRKRNSEHSFAKAPPIDLDDSVYNTMKRQDEGYVDALVDVCIILDTLISSLRHSLLMAEMRNQMLSAAEGGASGVVAWLKHVAFSSSSSSSSSLSVVAPSSEQLQKKPACAVRESTATMFGVLQVMITTCELTALLHPKDDMKAVVKDTCYGLLELVDFLACWLTASPAPDKLSVGDFWQWVEQTTQMEKQCGLGLPSAQNSGEGSPLSHPLPRDGRGKAPLLALFDFAIDFVVRVLGAATISKPSSVVRFFRYLRLFSSCMAHAPRSLVASLLLKRLPALFHYGMTDAKFRMLESTLGTDNTFIFEELKDVSRALDHELRGTRN